LFILIPIAELYVIIKVGEAIGLVPTLVLLLADAVLGSMLLRQQGRAAWVRFNRALAENRLPHKEVFDGVLIILGGALLITPGAPSAWGHNPRDLWAIGPPADGTRRRHLLDRRPATAPTSAAARSRRAIARTGPRRSLQLGGSTRSATPSRPAPRRHRGHRPR